MGRVLSEDDDYIVIEFGKHDGAAFHVAPVPGDPEPRPNRFLTALFVHSHPAGGMDVWRPWEHKP